MNEPISDTPAAPQYKDDDLVYVDPETRTVMGKVEWAPGEEKPKSKVYIPVADKDGIKRGMWRKTYPWGTYKSMRRIYKIAGKVKDPEPNRTFEEVLPRALSEAFWVWDEKKIEN